MITQEKDEGVKIVLSYHLQQNVSVELHIIQICRILKQFPLQLGEAGAASKLDILDLDIIKGGPRYCYSLTVSALFQVKLLFAWRRLCQGKGTCMQSEALVDIDSVTVKKK